MLVVTITVTSNLVISIIVLIVLRVTVMFFVFIISILAVATFFILVDIFLCIRESKKLQLLQMLSDALDVL